MNNIIQAMSNALSMIKGFDTGTTSISDDKMILDYKDERYIVRVVKMESKDEDMFKDIERYI